MESGDACGHGAGELDDGELAVDGQDRCGEAGGRRVGHGVPLSGGVGGGPSPPRCT